MSEFLFTQAGTKLHVEVCCACKATFAISYSNYLTFRQSAEAVNFYCPHGHQQHYTRGESAEQRLIRERNQAQQQLARAEDERSHAEARALKAERAIKSHKKRSAAGVCPCCNRTFTAMGKHMRTKHPDYVKTNTLKLVS